MSYATIDDLRSHLGQSAGSAAYDAKMMHDAPEGAIVDRPAFILERVTGKRVLDFGASGEMHQKIKAAASEYFGVDRVDAEGVQGFDLDDVSKPYLPSWSQTDFVRLDVLVCGEVIEHLANPGFFLQRIRSQFFDNPQHVGIQAIITVPNAFSRIGWKHMQHGVENVNLDHVAWYSPRTLRTLLERYGYTIRTFAYYNGDGPTAEGLIAVVD